MICRILIFCIIFAKANTLPHKPSNLTIECMYEISSPKAICRKVTIENMYNITQQMVNPPTKIAFMHSTLENLNRDVFPIDFFKNVNSLDFNWCNIEYIAPGTFENFTLLTTLSLANNNLRFIESGVFKNLRILKTLDLASNRITGQLYAKNFTGLEIIQFLDLSMNNISKLENNIFISFDILSFVFLSRNKISRMDFYSNKSNEEEIDLSYNEIITIENMKKPNLKSLYLQKNNITYVYKGIFEKYENLLNLNLGYNNIALIPDKTFSSLNQLRSLNISYNNIETINKQAFYGLKKLEVLSIDHNKIKYLRIDIFSFTPNLNSLHVTDIPYICSPKFAKEFSKIEVRIIADEVHCPEDSFDKYQVVGLPEKINLENNIDIIENESENDYTLTEEHFFANPEESSENRTKNHNVKKKERGNSTFPTIAVVFLVLILVTMIGLLGYKVYQQRRRNNLDVDLNSYESENL